MNANDGPSVSGGIAATLQLFRSKHVELWSENGQLRYRARKGVLTEEELGELRKARGEIIRFLEATDAGRRPGSSPPHGRQRAPLTFSQLAHWRLHRLYERRGIRQIAAAVRMRGDLNVEALRKSLAEVVRRHAALRTRIVIVADEPMQEIVESMMCELHVESLTDVPETLREREVGVRIEQLILGPVDVTVDPLFAVRLLRLASREHVLIVAMEHLISDAFSMGVLMGDLWAAYAQATTGRAFSLPDVSLQFSDHAILQSAARRSWVKRHGAYWNERLAGCGRLRFPEERRLDAAVSSPRETVSVRIDSGLKAQLLERCRQRRTTLVMSVFTAYVALVLRWCNASESTFQYQTDGRISPDMQDAIGYFASVLYLRIQLSAQDSFIDLLKRVTLEYCNAYEHADSSYMAAQVPRPEFTWNTVFNWVPQGLGVGPSGLTATSGALECSAIPFAYPKVIEIDYEPTILLHDTGEEIVGGIYFSPGRVSEKSMERFARNFLRFVDILLKRPEGLVMDIQLI